MPPRIPPLRRRRGGRGAGGGRRRAGWAALAAVAIALAMLQWAGSALGGSRIRSVATCPNAYVIMGPSAAAEKQFQATMLCLVNAVRKAFVAKGYHPAAYDEGFDDLPTGATPYWFVSHMLSRHGLPCTQVLDPRFRDFGVASTGVVNHASPLPYIFTLAMEFGLRAGRHQPSSNTQAAASCPHDIPAPVVTGLPVKYASTPAPRGARPQGAACFVSAPLHYH